MYRRFQNERTVRAEFASFGTKYADIARELESMGECIDVAVISHVDNDHLGGLLCNLRLVGSGTIKFL